MRRQGLGGLHVRARLWDRAGLMASLNLIGLTNW